MNHEFFESPFWAQLSKMAEDDYFRLANRLLNNTDANFTMLEYAYLRGQLDKIKELMLLEERFITEKDQKRKAEQVGRIRDNFWERVKGILRRTLTS